jgi:hypothetical protein
VGLGIFHGGNLTQATKKDKNKTSHKKAQKAQNRKTE